MPDKHRRHSALDEVHFELPIVDDRARIVGWTKIPPQQFGVDLIHPEAQALVGEVRACYVEIADPQAAQRAGAPPGWTQPWRCLALCSARMQTIGVADDEAPVVKVE